MKRKINIQLLVLTALAMCATLVLVVGTFYGLFKNEMSQNLKAYAHALSSSGSLTEEVQKDLKEEKEIRITLINPDGTILYDNRINKEHLDNHRNRPEVMMALQKGEGTDTRYSVTVDKVTLYYAIKMDNDMILRVAKETDSIWSVFKSVFPIIGICATLIFGICIMVAHFMTKSLVAPIEKLAMDIEDNDTISTYKELVPFINTIQKQHNDIIKSAEMRQEFTANVSHELKTPLTAISGYAELIESGMANGEDMRHFASEIHQNCNRLLTLINDIIQLSELDSKEIEVDFVPIDLYQVANECVKMLQINASQHDISLSIKGSSGIINGNKAMIEEVIVNLCDNAIRYSNKGGKVWVSVEAVNDQVILSIKDTGIGISKENQQRIFERFYRVDKSRSKSTGGTGLGLAIVKHIVVKHYAHMEIESELGHGTEIRVIFNRIES